jgi:hypothetical protein
VISPEDLSGEETERLFSLYAAHYDAADRGRFLADLADKDHVILLRDAETGLTRGFSTQKILRTEIDGRPVRALFSGDTIVDRSYWGEQELVRAWGRYAGRLLVSEPTPLWWLLISKGHRTYLYLPLFFKNYWPRFDAPVPDEARRLRHELASAKFGAAWDPMAGVLRFEESLGQLKPALAEVPPGRRDDPRVQFFLESNPGYARGEELVCLAEITPKNLRSIGLRAVSEGMAEGALAPAAACSIS